MTALAPIDSFKPTKGRPKEDIKERFISKIAKSEATTTCWIWTGSKNSEG